MKNSRCVWLIIWYVFVVISKFICHNIKAYLSNTTWKIFWARYYGLTGFSFDVQQPYNGWLILSEYAAPLTYLILVIIIAVIIVFVRFQNIFAQFLNIKMYLSKFQNVFVQNSKSMCLKFKSLVQEVFAKHCNPDDKETGGAHWYLSKYHNVTVQISKCTCPNFKRYLSKFQNVFVQISKCICQTL